MSIPRSIPIIIVLHLAAGTIRAQGRQENAIQTKEQKNIIPFVLARNKTILAVQAGKSRPLKIILDSGMGWDGLLVFKADLLDSLCLIDPKDMNLGGAGNGNGQVAAVSDAMGYSLGNMEFKNQRIAVLKTDHFKGFPNDGTIGYSLFGHFAVEIDYDRSILLLHGPAEFSPDPSWTEIPIYFRNNNIPWLDARIVIENEEPVTVSCYIDYASSEAIELLLKTDQKFVLPKATDEVYLGRGLNGDITGKRGMIAKVLIGQHEITNVLATFTAAAVRSKQPGADGVIANNLLRRFDLVFDYANKKLYIKPNGCFNEPF
jgi:hypothetical protein